MPRRSLPALLMISINKHDDDVFPETFNDELIVVILFNVVIPDTFKDETKVVLFTSLDIPLTFNIPK
jgi:hypothetical protein